MAIMVAGARTTANPTEAARKVLFIGVSLEADGKPRDPTGPLVSVESAFRS
jgi:hypothetical protein